MKNNEELLLNVKAIKEGLLKELDGGAWLTLCNLAAFIDAGGICSPSQELLAQKMGISRYAVSARIKKLLAYRWKGEPIVTAEKIRGENARYEKTIYTLDTSIIKCTNS